MEVKKKHDFLKSFKLIEMDNKDINSLKTSLVFVKIFMGVALVFLSLFIGTFMYLMDFTEYWYFYIIFIIPIVIGARFAYKKILNKLYTNISYDLDEKLKYDITATITSKEKTASNNSDGISKKSHYFILNNNLKVKVLFSDYNAYSEGTEVQVFLAKNSETVLSLKIVE